MKYKETNSRGSLLAWGIGLNYKYEPDIGILSILDATVDQPLLRVNFDKDLSKDPMAFICDIDKATQIYALMFSNNETLDLKSLFDDQKIVSLLQNSVKLAKYSYDLQNLNFKKFARKFCKDFDLKGVKIKQFPRTEPQSEFYVAKLKTKQNNSTKATSETLHGILRKLSEKTTNELIAQEYWSVNQDSAHDLLAVSTNLANISRILDKRFSPNRRIAKYANISASELMNQNGKKSN